MDLMLEKSQRTQNCYVKLGAKRQTRATNEWRQIHSSETVKRRSHMPIVCTVYPGLSPTVIVAIKAIFLISFLT